MEIFEGPFGLRVGISKYCPDGQIYYLNDNWPRKHFDTKNLEWPTEPIGCFILAPSWLTMNRAANMLAAGELEYAPLSRFGKGGISFKEEKREP